MWDINVCIAVALWTASTIVGKRRVGVIRQRACLRSTSLLSAQAPHWLLHYFPRGLTGVRLAEGQAKLESPCTLFLTQDLLKTTGWLRSLQSVAKWAVLTFGLWTSQSAGECSPRYIALPRECPCQEEQSNIPVLPRRGVSRNIFVFW